MLYLIMNHLFASYHRQILENRDEGTRFTARPLKQWRKQYQSLLGYSRAATGMPMDRPGGLVPVATKAIQCLTCNGTLAARVNVFKNPVCNSCQPKSYDYGAPYTSFKKNINDTRFSDTTFTNNKAYLQSRCVTYDQKLNLEAVPSNQYFSAEGIPLEPSDSPTGSQVREMVNCFAPQPIICKTSIYKPNNSQFAQQGGVSSSSRLARLKYNTLNNVPVNNNGYIYKGSVFNTAAGAMGLNSGLYQVEPSPSYYTKAKPQPTVCQRRYGTKSYCPIAQSQPPPPPPPP